MATMAMVRVEATSPAISKSRHRRHHCGLAFSSSDLAGNKFQSAALSSNLPCLSTEKRTSIVVSPKAVSDSSNYQTCLDPDASRLIIDFPFKMETNSSRDGHIVEILASAPDGNRPIGGRNKHCWEVRCEFESAGTSLADSAEKSASMRKLLIAVVLCVIFMSIEVIGGIKSNSLAILTDAAHLLSDVAAFAISLFSLWASGWESNPRQSYGFFRVEILGALISIQLIWLLAGILVYEAIVRLINDTGDINGFLMFLVSAFGLVVNIIMALVLGHSHGHGHGHDHGHSHDHGHGHVEPLLKSCQDGQKHEKMGEHGRKKKRNINLQGAYLHVLGDSIQSIGVMIGGGIIWYKPEWKIVDLICTLVFSVIVLGTTFKMFRDILGVLMESTPREIDATKMQKGLLEMEEVVAIHELHVWALTLGKVLMACHVKITPEAEADLVLNKVTEYIRREYSISHVTVQIEL